MTECDSIERSVSGTMKSTAVRIKRLIFPMILLAGTAISAAGQNKSIVILAPHPDDEALCCSGVIYNALQQGNRVNIVVVTNGDSGGTSVGFQRERETMTGMGLLGLTQQNVIFMGYGDQALQGLYQSTSPTTVIASPAGQTQTYANQGLGSMSYHQYLYGVPGAYNRQTILGDIEAMLQNLRPDEIYTTGLWDEHPDHSNTFTFLMEAILALRRQGVSLPTRVHETFIHAPCSSCGTPVNSNYMWPGGGVGIQPVFTPSQPFSQPYYLNINGPNGFTTPYDWRQIEILPAPASMQNPTQSANLKSQIIASYPSQTDIPNGYLFSFAKNDEFFWVHDFSTNIAGLATVTVSSQNSGSGQLGTSAVDGYIEGIPGNPKWEWVTQGELAGAWINLAWPAPVTISQVVLYNRQTTVEDIQSGHLTFSDGSTVSVGQLPINGHPYLVSFTPRTVTSMRFTVDNAVGQAIGLTEIEVYGSNSGTTINHPQLFQGITASAPYTTDAYGQNLTPVITDAQTTNLNVVAFDVNNQPLNYAWGSDSGAITGSGQTVQFSPPVVPARTLLNTSVTISDGQGGTVQANGYITITPSNSSGIAVSTLSLNPSSLQSGSISQATVTLNSVAPHGAVVALSSSNTAIATVPATVTVAPGASSAVFQVTTAFVSSNSSVTISASLGGVTVPASLNVLHPSFAVSSFTFNPPTVGGGNQSTGTVTLTGPAQGDATISLQNGSPSIVTIPASVTVPSGSSSVNFTATTQSVTAGTSVTISANLGGQITNATLRVAPYVAPNLATSATVSVSSESTSTQQQGIKAIDGIVDGSPGDYTKEWATNGQLAGAWLRLTWSVPVTATQVVVYDRPNATDNVTSATLSFSNGSTVPVSALPNDGSPLTVSFSARTVTWVQFTVNTAAGQNTGLAEIAVMGSAAQASAISSISVNPTTVVGGNVSTGTVALNGAAPTGGTVVNLASNNPSSATVPGTVTVPAGSLSTTFPITTYSVTSNVQVSISGTYNGTQSAPLNVVPVGVASVTLNPTMVQGGSANSSGTVTLTGPAPPSGAVITLTSSQPSAASVPATITIPSGSTSGTFTVTTAAVAGAVQVTISVVYNGTQTATLTVNPAVVGGGMQQYSADNFNRANGGLGTNWSTTIDSPSVPSITGQQVQSSWVYSTSLFYGGINWPADQYARAQVTQSNGGSSGPAVRMTSNAYYAGTVGSLGNGTAQVYIILNRAGNRSIIATSTTATVLANDYLQLTVQGTTLTLTNVTRSTTLLTVTDSTLAAGYPGLYVGNGGSLANWSAGLNTTPATLQTVASDNFNRANSPNLGPNWSVGPGYFPIQIVSTQIESDGQGQPPGQGHGKEYYTAATFQGDQWSQAQVIQSNNDVNGALLRYQGNVDTHYVGFVSTLGGPGTCSVTIDSDTSGAPTVLVSDSQNCSVNSGDYVRFQVQGSLLSYIDVTTGALLLTVLDTGISGGSPGWSLSPVGGTPTAANWTGGQFSTQSQSQVTVSSVTLSQQSVAGGTSDTGTVTLNGPAPSGGAVVSLTSSNPTVAQVPASVTVAAGATTATFSVTTTSVLTNTSLTISATYGATANANLTVTAPAVTLSAVSVSPTSVQGGSSATGTVTLTGPAPAGGALVTLSSSSTATAQVPASVTVAANATTATFTVTTSPVATNTTLSISATYGATQSASLTVTSPAVSSVAVSPTSIQGGSSVTGTVTLTGPAPAGGAVVTLSSNNTAAAQVPASVTVAANATTATFTVTTSVVAATSTATISATYGATQTANLTVTTGGALSTVTLNPASVIGGTSSTATVTLASAAPAGGAVVTLASSNTAAAQVPASVTVAAGETTASFSVTTSPVASNTLLTISATFGGTQSANLTVTTPATSSVSLNPTSVVGGTSSTGTVTLNGPAPTGGAVVTLSSSNTAAAQVSASVTVAAGATTATFTVTTSPVASNVSLTISATLGGTQSASLTVTAPTASSVSLNPTSVIGGTSSTGTVTLSSPAPTGGAVVALSSSNTAAAQVPASVTVAAGATTATFTVTTSPVASNTLLSISATFGGTQSANLTVTAPVAGSVSLNPTSVIGGTSSTGTVTLNGPAPTGGSVVALSSSNTAAAQVPASVTVAAGATTATFTVTTSPVASNTLLSISATFGGTQSANLTVTALVASSVSLNPTSVLGGTSSTGTVTLSGPAPTGGAVVALSSSNTAAAQVPASVTVAAGATSATFSVTTTPVAGNTTVTIGATYGTTSTANLTVSAATLAAAGSGVSVSPTSVTAGTSSTGTVRLTGPAPAGGAVVSLSSSNTTAAQVPATVTVAAGATSATFTVATAQVASNTSVTITAVYGVTRTASLTVTPLTLSGNGNGLGISPNSVIGGNSSTGSVRLTGPAPAGGAVVSLSSSNTAAAQVPATVTVPAGATSTTFTVTTAPVASNTSATITAIYGATRTASLTVTPPTPASVALNPTTVRGGSPSTGTVTLSGPAPSAGTVVNLSSSSTSVATVPSNVTVAAGNTTATFTVSTRTVTSTRSVTISASTTRNTTRSATLSVTP